MELGSKATEENSRSYYDIGRAAALQSVTQYWQMRSSVAAVLPLQLGGEKPKVLMGRAEKFWAQFLQATH